MDRQQIQTFTHNKEAYSNRIVHILRQVPLTIALFSFITPVSAVLDTITLLAGSYALAVGALKLICTCTNSTLRLPARCVQCNRMIL